MLDTNEKRGVPAGSRGARREAGGAAPFARRPGPRRAGESPPSRRRRTEQGRAVDALAPGGDEGRDKRRYARGRRKWPLIPGFPNGATRRTECPASPDKGEAHAGN